MTEADINHILLENQYLKQALRSTESGSQAMTEFLLHLERYEMVREENQRLREQLAYYGAPPLCDAV